MKALYIGQYGDGTTSRMRAKALHSNLSEWDFQVIDTSQIINSFSRFSKSMAFRFKAGPVVNQLNHEILKKTPSTYDLVWVDKGIWLKEDTVLHLKSKSSKLIHYTPDCAFLANRSRHFERSMRYYDFFITTKSFEDKFYPKERTLNVLQGYDEQLHKPHFSFEEKFRDVIFIGLYEPARYEIIKLLLKNGIKVSLCGVGWNRIRKFKNVEFLGEKLFDGDYAEAISSSFFALGLMSKKFPELHTTRTIEIPACQTALITERNAETTAILKEDQAVFYNTIDEIPNRIRYLLDHKNELEGITKNGFCRIKASALDYDSLMKKILKVVLD